MSKQHLSGKFKHAMGASCSVLALLLAAPAAMAQTEVPTIVPADPGTSETILDTATDVTGVGMFFRNDGFVCTGTLINPRTVIFAAHCVNDRPASDYGTDGAIAAAFSFGADSLPGFLSWINNSFTSNPDMAVFNINQIIYNLDSIARPGSFGFQEGDVALSVLDTPASEVPTWALLFSALPAPTSYTQETGSGYHVNLTGYGRSGTALDGAIIGIDWRRRAAENFIGALTSFDERNTFLFGAPFGDLPQNLYRLDFDDPNRTNPYDFDLYRGNAATNEGTTAGGDSGGPLILDAANNPGIDEDLVIGVLSGGSRFFGPQAFSSYGTESFYQPLYLFWDWIVANSPYRYVAAAEGDGAWEDASHWLTEIDPAFRVIDANGNVVNGLPTNPGVGVAGTDPSWGEVCFAPGGVSGPGFECVTLEDGDVHPYDGTAPSAGGDSNAIGEVGNNIPGANSGLMVEDAPQNGTGTLALVDGEYTSDPLPAATLENGLPGATGFVPDNIDPNSGLGINARYFDVNLSAAGTTTLDSTVEIDVLTISGAAAGLDIGAAGDLTSLSEIMHQAGSVNVDGTLTTYGDYLLMSGMLSGSGTVSTPFLTNIMGLIAPGEVGGIGTLTIDGNAVLASASGLSIDIDASGASDLLVVTGGASLGGTVLLNPVAGYLPRFGDSYTFLTAGSITDAFGAVYDLPGVLKPVLSYTATSASVEIEAQNFRSQATFTNNFQTALGRALDGGRAGSYDDLAEVYGLLDLLEGDALTTALDTMSPYEAVMFDRSVRTHSDVLGRALREQIGTLGMMANGGDDILADAKQANGLAGMSDLGLLARATVKSGNSTSGVENGDMRRIFGSIGTIDATASTFAGSADSLIDGNYSMFGLDIPLTETVRIGAAAGFANSDNTAGASLGGTNVSTETEQLTAFASYSAGRISASLALGRASHESNATRTINLGGVMVPAQTRTTADESTVDAAIRYDLYSSDDGIRVTPMASITASNVDFKATTSYSSIGSLDINSRSGSNTIARIGSAFGLDLGTHISTTLYVGAAEQYGDGAETYSASFHDTNGVNFSAPSGVDMGGNWWEVAGSLSADLSFGGTLTVSHERQIDRDFSEIEVTTLSYSLPF
ncbi:autotransporter domain-containing protein [Maricaulis sp.]|uniref:autotransporter domain-containing protein n=1 Tax=Maricaulis sp. TaxID=1486257 RepID=UPI003A934345